MPNESSVVGGYLREVDDLRSGGATEVSYRAPLAAAACIVIKFLFAGRDMRTVLNLIQPEVKRDLRS